VSGQLHGPVALPPRGKSRRYPLDRRLRGPQSRCRRYGEEKHLLLLPGIEPRLLGRPARCLIAISTQLSRLPYWNRLPMKSASDPKWILRLSPRSGHVGFVVDKVALGQVFSEYFGFPCQSSFHQLLNNHHHKSSGAGTIGQQWPTCQVDSVSPHPEKLKKKIMFKSVSSQ
jgi:hypothetical protein